MTFLAPVQRQPVSLREQVTEHLRDAILDGRVQPGQKLIERELCQALDISRALLREALQQLRAEGLIITSLHKGPSVALIGAEEAGQIYEVRQVLEALAVESFARNASPAQVRALREQVEFLKSFGAGENPRGLLVAKNGFYAVLFEGCGNSVVGTILTQLANRMMLFRRLSLSTPGRTAEMLDELEGIVAAIEAIDPEKAATLCSAHVANAHKTVMRQLEKTQSVGNSPQEAHGQADIR